LDADFASFLGSLRFQHKKGHERTKNHGNRKGSKKWLRLMDGQK
jgi:hypothetical protein